MSFCIGVREVGRIYNVRLIERTMRTPRRRGENDRGDSRIVFAIRAGETQGPRVDWLTSAQAVAGDDGCIRRLAEIVAAFYDCRSVKVPDCS